MMREQPEPRIAQRGPYIVDLAPGRHAWCSCGRSAGQPFCDGSHKGTGHKPIVFEITEARSGAALCGCKHSGDKPYCDGTHGRL